MPRKRLILITILCLALSILAALSFIGLQEERCGSTTVAFLNVGQGDAIFIDGANGTQVVIDGGPDNHLIDELSKLMPFYDHDINFIIVTNPDKDHMAGFIPLLDNYTIGRVIEPGTFSSSTIYKELQKKIKDKNIPKTIARAGMKIDLGRGVELEIVFPDRDVSNWKTNDGSIVAILHSSVSVIATTTRVGNVFLMGDAPQTTELYLLKKWQRDGISFTKSLVKLGHHGSRTSSNSLFLKNIGAQMAIISAGYHNIYHHPHPETLENLKNLSIPYLITYEFGTIIFKIKNTQDIKNRPDERPNNSSDLSSGVFSASKSKSLNYACFFESLVSSVLVYGLNSFSGYR